MSQRLPRAFMAFIAVLAMLAALPSASGALPISPSYPRVIAVMGTGGGVRLTQLQAKLRLTGHRVRVSIRLAGASTGGPHRMVLSATACSVHPPKYTASSPQCPATAMASYHFSISGAPFSLSKTLTIPRPSATSGAVRVRLVPTTSTEPAPSCRSGAGAFYLRATCIQFPQTGELLLNGGTWAFKPGTWWGIVASAPAGFQLDRVGYNSRTAGWVATSPTAVTVDTTQGYADESPAHVWHTPLAQGVQNGWRTEGTFGGEGRTRTAIRVLDYAAALGGQRLFTMTLPLPKWTHQPTRR